MAQGLFTAEFAIFFAALFVVYHATRHRFKWLIMLAGSAYFYLRSDGWEHLLVLIVIIGVNYCLVSLIQITERPPLRRLFFILCLSFNLSTLLFFKYSRLATEPFLFSAEVVGAFAMPLGLSYLSLKASGYAIDIYRKKVRHDRHFGRFALFNSFFLEIPSGPIDRARNLLPQINTGIAHRDPGVGQVGAGLVNPPREAFHAALEALAEHVRAAAAPHRA